MHFRARSLKGIFVKQFGFSSIPHSVKGLSIKLSTGGIQLVTYFHCVCDKRTWKRYSFFRLICTEKLGG